MPPIIRYNQEFSLTTTLFKLITKLPVSHADMHSLNSNPLHHPIQKIGTDAGQQGISHVGWATALSLPNMTTVKIPTDFPSAIHTLQRENVGYKKPMPDLPG